LLRPAQTHLFALLVTANETNSVESDRTGLQIEPLQTFFHPPRHLFEIIAGMIRVDRSAIDIACIAIAALLNLLLEPVVAGLA
jgi:hypothetical protein